MVPIKATNQAEACRRIPRYPIYVISKGRWESRLTAKALENIGCPYRIVIEPPEFNDYSAVIDPAKILVLPFADLGQGSIPARNWVWEHSISEGHQRHWILDDNIRYFLRASGGCRYYIATPCIFAEAEDFIDRYANVPMSGFQYAMFGNAGNRPFHLNTRIYSCILLSNDLNMRWRGRYNEDTDLSLRVMKAGYCTLLFYAYLCAKQWTGSMKGGNTDDLYKDDGRLKMAQSLVDQHPDVVRITWRYGRWQHLVDYSSFRAAAKLLKR